MADRGTVRRRGRGFGARGGFKRQQQREDEVEEQQNEAPEVKSLREKYGPSVESVQAVFPDWDEVSVLYALSEAHGSVELAISRIVEGQAEQWGSVKPKKQQKKETSSIETSHDGQASTSALSGRGSFGGRGRGRGDFRGGRGGFRGGARGGRGGAVAGRQPANGEVTVTEVTEASVNADGTVSTTTVTEAEGEGVTEVSIKEASTDAEGTTVQVEETISVVEKPQQAAKPSNGWAQKGKGPATAVPAPAVSAAKKAPQPGVKLSWAQIARPPSPKPQPAPVPKAAPVQATPAAEAAPAPVEKVVVAEVVATEPEPVVVITEVEAPVEEAARTAPQDPWSSTPAAAVLSSEEQQPAEPTALPVGEGWADSIIAKNDYDQAQQVTPEEQAAQEAQHQRAQEAAPPAGVNPAGALDVHTPSVNELPSQPAAQQSMAPPGLTKRATATRGKQDAPVVMPGATPDIERMGVQFGSLNLFGSIPAAAEIPIQDEAPQQPQQSLYETAPHQHQLPQQHEVQQPTQSLQDIAQQHAQQAPSDYDIQQQAQAQYYQSQAQKQQPSQYGGVFDRFGAPQQQQQQHYQAPQQQQQQAPTSAYSSRYQPFGQPAQQQQLPQDPFASVTSPYLQNVARTGSAQQQHQPSVPSLGGVDSISPYYSSQQAQNLQSHQSTQTQQSAASPAPQSVRDSAGSVPPQQAASAYGGFTSAIGQATQAQQPQQQQGYPSDYSNYYGMQDQTRNLQSYYGQTEQAAQQPYRVSATDDLTAKLGASSNTAASGLSAQPQQQQQLGQQQQQQHYNPNMMGGYNYPYYPYGGGYGNPSYGGPGYPAYPSHQYNYGGYNQNQNRSAYQGAGGANHSHQNSTGAGNNAYSRTSGLGAYGNNAPAGLSGSAGASNYGSNAYGSFDSNSNRGAQSGVQGLGQGQQDRSGDAFSDPRYTSNY